MTGKQSTPTIALKRPQPSRLAELSKLQLGGSSRPLTGNTFVERRKKRELKKSAKKSNCASVSQRNPLVLFKQVKVEEHKMEDAEEPGLQNADVLGVQYLMSRSESQGVTYPRQGASDR